MRIMANLAGDGKPPKPLVSASTTAESKKSTAALVIAGLLTAAYLVFVGLLVVWFVVGDGADKKWDHAQIIFNALSAIAFSAVGVLLGTTVQQVNVANAKKETDKAKAHQTNLAERAKDVMQAA